MEKRDIKLPLLTSIVLYYLISYIRALVSVAIIAEDLMDLSYGVIIASIVIIPFSVFLTLWKLDLHLSLLTLLASFGWITLQVFPHEVKVYPYLIGFGLVLFTVPSLLNEGAVSSVNLLSVVVITIFLDALIRSTNHFQGVLFTSTIGAKIIGVVSVIAVFLLSRNLSIEMRYAPRSNDPTAIGQILISLAFFISLYFYSLILGNPSALTFPLDMNYLVVIIIFEIVVLGLVSFMLSTKILPLGIKSRRVGILAGLSFSLILVPPWSTPFLVFFMLSWVMFVPLLTRILNTMTVGIHPLLLYGGFGLSLVFMFVLLIGDYVLLSLSAVVVFALIVYKLGKYASPKVLENGHFLCKKLIGTSILIILILTLFSSLPLSQQRPAPVPSPGEISVLNYNIHFGIDQNWSISLENFAALVSKQDPHILTLQEIVSSSPTNAFFDYYGRLKQALRSQGFRYSVLSAGSYFHVRNAVFSRFPIKDQMTVTLEPVLQYPRSALIAHLVIGSTSIYVVSTHLTNIGSSNGTQKRQDQVYHLLDAVKAGVGDYPRVLAGDFNAVPSSKEYQMMTLGYVDAWLATNQTAPGYTSPAENPSKRIDYIFVSEEFLPVSCEVILTQLSDHLPLLCNIKSL